MSERMLLCREYTITTQNDFFKHQNIMTMETVYWIEIRRHGNDAYFMTTCRNDDSPIKEFMVVNSCLFKSFLIDDSIDIDRPKRFAAYQIYFNEIPNIPNSRITKKRHPIELLSYCFDQNTTQIIISMVIVDIQLMIIRF